LAFAFPVAWFEKSQSAALTAVFEAAGVELSQLEQHLPFAT